jgi:4-diphosphocytidyl-2-C-methyl-D-erythritol kinase
VLGRRSDGYHALDSVFHTVGLYDRVTLEDGPPGVRLTCSDADLGGPDNLAARAARAVLERLAPGPGVRIHLEKAIPAGAGLGGGSSDAAAVLTGMARLRAPDWPPERLAELAASLGSDVPFFLHGGAARVTGRGERVAPLAPREGTWCLLLNPGLTVSTAAVYAAYDRENPAQVLTPGPTPSIIGIAPSGAAARAEAPPEREPGAGGGPLEAPEPVNDLEPAACRVAPGIADALAAMREAGAEGARMTGSGGAVFCLAPSRAALERIQERLVTAPRWEVWLVPLTGAGVPCSRNGV